MLKKTSSFVPFDDPAHLLSVVDKDILEEKVKLYPWQCQIAAEFAKDSRDGGMNEMDIVAANDSGKSKMVIAPAALWSVCQYDKSSTVLTTASGTQLDKQSGRYIKDYAKRMNGMFRKWGETFEIQHRSLKCLPTDGCLDLFATDEAGKAEGWHKRDFESAMTLIVDEAKSVSNDIFVALDRCHDAQRYLRCSSPSIGTDGFFYKAVTGNRSWVRKVTAYECPHISKATIEKIIRTYGLHSPITKSIIFAEFSSTNESVVITFDSLLKLLRNKPLENTKDQPLRVGGDLAAGGDENVISIWKGNKEIALECFKEPDTTKTRDAIIFIFNKYNVAKNSEHLFFDDGGVGHGIIDMLREKGFNITRVLNQGKPLDSSRYSNRGAELWMNFASFIHNEEIIFLDHCNPSLEEDKRIAQLANRYYKQSAQGKILLESKKDAKAKGHSSPDRADATVLAFTGLKAPYFSLLGGETAEQKNDGKSIVITQKELVEWMDRIKFGEAPRMHRTDSPLLHSSMQALLATQSDGNSSDRFSDLDDLLKQYNYGQRN